MSENAIQFPLFLLLTSGLNDFNDEKKPTGNLRFSTHRYHHHVFFFIPNTIYYCYHYYYTYLRCYLMA
jgi:hypothetical protein